MIIVEIYNIFYNFDKINKTRVNSGFWQITKRKHVQFLDVC